MKDLLFLEKNNDIKKTKFKIEEYAILQYIDNDSGCELIDIDEYFEIDTIKIIKKMAKDTKIKLEINSDGKNNNWILKLIYDDKINENNSLKIFHLNDNQINELSIISNGKIKLECLIKYFDFKLNGFFKNRQINLNNKNDYLEYIKSNNPIQILIDNNVSITKTEIEFLYKYIYIEKSTTPVLNICIDYCIKNSIYNNFSISFANKIIDNWKKNNLCTVDEVLLYLKNSKQIKEKGNYVDPKWTTFEKNKNIISVDEMKKRLMDNCE